MSGGKLDRREIIGLAAPGAAALGAKKAKAKPAAAPDSSESGPGVRPT